MKLIDTRYYLHTTGICIKRFLLKKSNENERYVLDIKYNTNKKIISKTWLYSAIKNYDYSYHRINGPAYIQYYDNGNLKTKQYFINGRLHREDGPAVIEYYPDGKLYYKAYYNNSSFHNEKGPAIIELVNGIYNKSFYIHGKYILVYTTKELKNYIKALILK